MPTIIMTTITTNINIYAGVVTGVIRVTWVAANIICLSRKGKTSQNNGVSEYLDPNFTNTVIPR